MTTQNLLTKSNGDKVPLGLGFMLICPEAGSKSEIIAKGGYKLVPSIEAFEFQPQSEAVPVKVSTPNGRAADREIVADQGFSYGINVDQIDGDLVVRPMIGGGAPTPFSQGALTAQATDALVFDATNKATPDHPYLLTIGGAPVRKITAISHSDMTPMTEGTDFFCDYENGLVWFAAEQTASVTFSVDADQITTGGEDSFNVHTMFRGSANLRSMACLYLYDVGSKKVFWRHEDFRTDLRYNGNKTVNMQQSPFTLLAPVSYAVPGRLETRY